MKDSGPVGAIPEFAAQPASDSDIIAATKPFIIATPATTLTAKVASGQIEELFLTKLLSVPETISAETN
jgi:hypothetical protein